MSKRETLKEIWEFLERDDLLLGETTSELPLVIPFELKPEDFIDFAKQDLKEKTERSMVNALSNIKRAIDCRISSLLYLFGVYNKAKTENWSFPKSADFLLRVGVLAPNILKKINRKRNELEHDFKKPTYEEVTDYFDVASLFLALTNQFLHRDYLGFEVMLRNEHFPWISIKLNYKKQLIEVELVKEKSRRKKLEISSNDEEAHIKILSHLVKHILNR